MAEELAQLLNVISPLLVQYVRENSEKSTKVVDFHSPQELKGLLDLNLNENGEGIEGAVKVIQDALKYSVRTGNPKFFDKLYVGSDPIGMIGELITAALNTNLHVYRVSPVFTLMEVQVIQQLGKLYGYENADGLTNPGGTVSNMLAMLCARNTLFPSIKNVGLRGETLVAFTSSEGHYSISKIANIIGMGQENVIKISTNEFGEMIPEELEKKIEEAIKEGKKPFFVNATAGTTVKGAFDPFEAIGKIAKKYGIWFHIDACWGGTVIFSTKYKHLMNGCELSDSIVWNPHKLGGVTLQMSVLLVKKKGLLQASNESNAGYLFHGEEYDLGDKTFQCGRKPDVFKLFLTWKFQGTKGFVDRIDHAFESISKFNALLESRPEFRLAFPSRTINSCFWYYPQWLEEIKNEEEKIQTITKLTSLIGEKVNQIGNVMLDHSPYEKGDHFRFVVNNPKVGEPEMNILLDEISSVGKIICEEHFKLNK